MRKNPSIINVYEEQVGRYGKSRYCTKHTHGPGVCSCCGERAFPFYDSNLHPVSDAGLRDAGTGAGVLAGSDGSGNSGSGFCNRKTRAAAWRARATGYLVGYGLVLALFNALWTLSVALNGVAVATVLVYSSAGFTALLGWLILKEDLTLVKILVVVLSLLGCALVVNAFNPSVWGLNTTGVITGISAGLFYAVYSIMGRSASQRGLNTWTTIFYIFTFASMFMLGFNLLSGGNIPGSAARPADMLWLGNAWVGWLMLAALAVGPTLMGYGLYNVSLSYLPSSTANLVVMIEPVFTAVFAYVLFGEMLTAAQLVGGAMILGAVAVLRLGKK